MQRSNSRFYALCRRLCFLPFLLFSVKGAAAASGSSDFSGQVRIDGGKYQMKIHMRFAPEVPLHRVVGNIKNGALLSQISPTVKSVTTYYQKLRHTYLSVLTVQNFGVQNQFMSECNESDSFDNDFQTWRRQCQLDLNLGQASRFMKLKIENTVCRQKGPVECTLEVTGEFKSFLFIKDTSLAVKAKYQALYNWAVLWAYTQNESVSLTPALHFLEMNGILKKLKNLEMQHSDKFDFTIEIPWIES